MIQHEEGMLHPALQCYLKAIELDPEQSKIWCNLGALQFQLGEFQHSVDSLNPRGEPETRLCARLGQPGRIPLRPGPIDGSRNAAAIAR